MGIAAAVALLGTATGGGAVAGERAARELVARLPATERSVRVGWSGGVPDGVEARSRRALRTLTAGPQTATTLLLPTVAQRRRGAGVNALRHFVQLAAVAPLSRWVRLSSGRLPASCTPVRCEVLALGGPRVPDVLVRDRTQLVTVGRGRLTSRVPLGFVPRAAGPGLVAEARPRSLLVGGDPRAVEDLPGFATVFRSSGWSAPLTAGAEPSWRLDALRERIERTANALTASDASYSVQAPSAALRLARERAGEARRRVVLVGAGAAALLAAFALLAAGALRRDLAAEHARLRRRGARGWQLGVLSAVECGWPAVVGTLTGAGIAVAITAVRAHDAGLDAGGVLRHSLLTGGGLAGGLLCLLAGALLLGLGARTWPAGGGRAADALALACAGALALMLARGGQSAGDGGDPLPAVLAPLACLAAGVVVARGVAPVLRGAEVASRRGPLTGRLAALGLARDPGGPSVTVAVVAVSFGLACFAAAYGATLADGQRDQAAYRAPADVVVRETPEFVAPLAIAPIATWRHLAGPGGRVLPVHRGSSAVPRGAQRISLPTLGLPSGDLDALRGWRPGDASLPRSELERRLGAAGPVAVRGALIGAGDRRLSVRAATRGDGLELTAHLVAGDGSSLAVGLGPVSPRMRTLRAALPAAAAGRRLVAIEATPQSGLRATEGHQKAESPAARSVVQGTVRLEDLTIGDRTVDVAGWTGRGPMGRPAATPRGLRAPFRFEAGGRALLRPVQPTDGRTLAVVTDPETARGAARGALLPLIVDGTPLRGRVVGTVRRLATVDPDAGGVVLADEAALRTALSADAPGTGRANELWVDAPGAGEARVRAALATPRFSGLDALWRDDVQDDLRGDPLASELARTLTVAAIVAVVLAAAGVALATLAGLRDDRGALLDLEALGAGPAALRAQTRLRAAVLAVLGLAAGLVLGVGLLALVVGAVQLTATGTVAVPPIVAVVPWATWAVAGAAFCLAVAAAVGLLTRRPPAGAGA